MPRQVAEGVLIHESEFLQSNAVVVQGQAGVLLIDVNSTADPVEDCLVALRLLEGVAGDVDVVIPGHGSVGGADQVDARIDQDRAYVQALRDAGAPEMTGPAGIPPCPRYG